MLGVNLGQRFLLPLLWISRPRDETGTRRLSGTIRSWDSEHVADIHQCPGGVHLPQVWALGLKAFSLGEVPHGIV